MEDRYKLKMTLILTVSIALMVVFVLKWSGTNIQPTRFGTSSTRTNQQKSGKDSPNNGITSIKSKATSTESENDTRLEHGLLSENKAVPSADEDDISNLDLPAPFTEEELTTLLRKAEAKRIWIAQDKAIRTWPAYLDVREDLHKELAQELNLDILSEEELVDAALKFREGFWQVGGDFSRNSYGLVYKARILLELAHSQNPKNLGVTDELVETIQTAYPATMFDPETNRKLRNDETGKLLLELRSRQFEQVKEEIYQDVRLPTWQDFACGVDLAVLLSHYDKTSAKEVLDWLQRESSRGGWGAYNDILRNLEHQLSQGGSFNLNIYVAAKHDPREVFRYGRRYPSFRGPNTDERGVVLWGRDLAGNTTTYHTTSTPEQVNE